MKLSQSMESKHFRVQIIIESTTVEAHSFMTAAFLNIEEVLKYRMQQFNNDIEDLEFDVAKHMKGK